MTVVSLLNSGAHVDTVDVRVCYVAEYCVYMNN